LLFLDIIPAEMKLEFQEKVGEYLSLNLGSLASTSDASKVIPSDDDDTTADEICTGS